MAKKNSVPETYPAFPRAGVLTRDDQPEYAQALTRADSEKGLLRVSLAGLSPVTFPTESITADQNTGRLSFISSNTPYRIRELREDDGEWLSKYKTYLPIEALYALVSPTAPGDDLTSPRTAALSGAPETLDAYSMDDSVYIVGVVYTNSQGRWSRIDGDWILLSPTDDSYAGMSVTHIDPDQADTFLDFYDQNYVSITDAEKYAGPDGE